MPMTTNAVLQTVALTKQYPGKLALDHLDLTVNRGEIFGYLGPNGAGKTTTIRLLLDLIRPTSGSVSILGMNAHKQSVSVKRLIGNLPGELRLWDHLTGLQTLQYLAGLRPGCDFNYALELAERLDVNLSRRVRDCSTGNKRKLGIIQALMHKPSLLILDEPTAGLDPLMQQTFNQLMLEIRAEGRTVFLSSHVLSEVENICDRVGILRNGQLKAVERIADLKRVHYRWVTIRTHDAVHVESWQALPGVHDLQIRTGQIRLRHSGSFDALIKFASQYNVQDFIVEEPSLEELFLTFYSESER
jgi:ABC-2 type transport system ATP-binding protein